MKEYRRAPTSIEVYHDNEENRIEVFPAISSQIMYSYLKDSLNINSQSSIIQSIIVGAPHPTPSTEASGMDSISIVS